MWYQIVLFELVKRIFLMRWLWTIFSSFYLIAYAFWIPTLFDNILAIIPILGSTLVVGGGLLVEGAWRVLELDKNITTKMPGLPKLRIWQALGGIFLISYILVYIPEEGRVVAHWPLDLAITIIAGIIILVFSIRKN